MIITEIDDNIKNMLQKTGFSDSFLKSCFFSKFLVAEIIEDQIAGVTFVGGFLNLNGIEVNEKYRGKGIGKKLLNELLDECKKRNISFLSGVFKPDNKISIHMHMKIGYIPLFSIFYNENEGREIIVLLPFNKKGKFIRKCFSIFNYRVGNFIFIILFKLSTPFLKNLIALDSDMITKIDFKKSIKNFKKVESLINF